MTNKFRRRASFARHTFPRSHFMALLGYFEKLVGRFSVVGMILWTDCLGEDESETSLLDAVAMSSFSVIKDDKWDRLIRWQRLYRSLSSFQDIRRIITSIDRIRVGNGEYHPPSTVTTLYLLTFSATIDCVRYAARSPKNHVMEHWSWKSNRSSARGSAIISREC